MAYNINSVNHEDYVIRRCFLKNSYARLSTLEKRVMDMVRILYTNPSKCFNMKNGKNYTYNEVLEMLDKKMADLGIMYQRQYECVMNSDKKNLIS